MTEDPIPPPPAAAAAAEELERHLERLFGHAGEHEAARRLRQLVLRHRLAQRQAALDTTSATAHGGADHA